jgi:ATP-dependent protease ClpP protease subunit
MIKSAKFAAAATVTAILATLGAILGLLFYRYNFLHLLEWAWNTLTPGGFMALLASAVTALSLVLSIKSWKYMNANGHTAGQGAVALLCVVVTFFNFCGTISFFQTSADITNTFIALHDMGDAEVFQTELGRVVVEGQIGENFFRDVTSYDTKDAPLKEIEINSGGGLVDQAMLVANFVETHKLVVTVNEQCMSACVLIAVASPLLQAHAEDVFGFHHTTAVTIVTSDLYKSLITTTDSDNRKYLADHGVPEEFLKQGDKFGSEDIYQVSAADLAKAGVVKKIIVNETADTAVQSK